MFKQLKFILKLTGNIVFSLFLLVLSTQYSFAATPTDPNFKVAFIGDSGNTAGFAGVLNLIKAEGAEVILHQGDFDYTDNARAFFTTIAAADLDRDGNTALSDLDFPYFASAGNHDMASWNDNCTDTDGCYAAYLKQIMGNVGAVPDDPDLNDQMHAVTFKGLKLVFAGQSGSPAGDNTYAPFIERELGSDTHKWKICSWHKNQTVLQLGSKLDDMGWKVYETCKKYGAIIATAHEHSYERTRTFSDRVINGIGSFQRVTLANQNISDIIDTTQHPLVNGVPGNPNNLLAVPGKTFAFVSGLGGNSIRNQDRCTPTVYPYGGGSGCYNIWAKAYTSDQGADYGALFITFNSNGDPDLAHGYFKTISGQVVDSFDVRTASLIGASPSPNPTPAQSPNTTPQPTPATPRGDLNGDGKVNYLDAEFLLKAWLASLYDLGADAKTNALDFAQLRSNWTDIILPTPSPSPVVTSPTPTPSPTPIPTPVPSATPVTGSIPTDPNFKVAMLSNTAIGANLLPVLNLIKTENAQLVLHAGDWDYVNNPTSFMQSVDSVLGPNFPFFAAVGDHEAAYWAPNCTNPNGCYASFITTRFARTGIVPDDPNLNDFMYSFTYKGLKVVFVGQAGATAGDTIYAPYIQNQLASDNHIWKICNWHKYQQALQVGPGGDMAGWKVYDSCKDLGAIIQTGHFHAYQRTRTLTDMLNQIVDPNCPDAGRLCVYPGNPGKSFVVVPALGGKSVDPQTRCLPATFPYGCKGEWASIYSASQQGTYGVLFITFNVNGDPHLAQGYFKDIAGRMVDQFTITKGANPAP